MVSSWLPISPQHTYLPVESERTTGYYNLTKTALQQAGQHQSIYIQYTALFLSSPHSYSLLSVTTITSTDSVTTSADIVSVSLRQSLHQPTPLLCALPHNVRIRPDHSSPTSHQRVPEYKGFDIRHPDEPIIAVFRPVAGNRLLVGVGQSLSFVTSEVFDGVP